MKLLLLPLCLLAGCTAAPAPLEPDHPASPLAAEAPLPSARSALAADANTRRTRELLAAREAQATVPAKEGHEHP